MLLERVNEFNDNLVIRLSKRFDYRMCSEVRTANSFINTDPFYDLYTSSEKEVLNEVSVYIKKN